jgi:hypothetical protein
MAALGEVTAPVKITTSGGDLLEVSFKLEGSGEGQKATGIFLKGGAEITFEGELDLDALLKQGR